jgi:hypothetical protein
MSFPCHSECSEESNWILLAESHWILRCAQNDKPFWENGSLQSPFVTYWVTFRVDKLFLW